MASASDYVMVAAIDFGTTFSGYAFSFRGSEEDIKVNKNWGESLGFQSWKTPTTVLTRGEKEFLAFGYEAEEKFAELEESESDDDDSPKAAPKDSLNLYRHFKMVLHRKGKLTSKTIVSSTSGQIVPAIEIFTHALRYLKDHLIDEVSKQLERPVDVSLIRWVLTVPAIWTDESKQFMRECAYRSGCIDSKDSKQLIIALEPEAASFFCRQLELARFEKSAKINFTSGTKYLILDCGGGTNDMVVHEVVLDYKVKEICVVNGGTWGGTKIDDRFIALMKDIFGNSFIEMFQKQFPQQWFSFITRFERAKKAAKPDPDSKMNIDIPWLMIEKYAAMNPNDTLPKAVKRSKSKGVSFKQGVLILSHEAVQGIFDETVQNIIDAIKGLVQSHNVNDLGHIFMVGGLCENKMLQQAVREQLGGNGCKILIPAEAQLAITKGAVLFGHHQDRVISRIARHSYGSGGSFLFDSSKHDPTKQFVSEDGKKMCDDIYCPIVNMGDEIELKSTKEITYDIPVNQTDATFNLYRMPKVPEAPVQYTDEPGVTTVGEIKVDMSSTVGTPKRKILLKMTFGNTEILAEAIDKFTGKSYSTTIDFLSG